MNFKDSENHPTELSTHAAKIINPRKLSDPEFENQIKKYERMNIEALENSEKFWASQAERLDWTKKWTKVKNVSFEKPVVIKWYEGGELNASYNCIDRHLKTRSEKTAVIFEPDDPSESSQKISYNKLYEEVCRFSHVLKNMGVQKGDFVTIYMPMIPETVYAILACARIGAPHCVVFGGFAPESLSDRMHDCDSKFVITADEGVRGGRKVQLKKNIDQALMKVTSVKKTLVIRRTGGSIDMRSGRDFWYHELIQPFSHFEPISMGAEDPLFILYTSGSTNKPKGVLHTTGGYLTYASLTHELVFDYRESDVYWCTADVGWITGHSYSVYGPLSNGATSLIFEGIPNYPDSSRFWRVIDKHQVTIFYTAPTAIRALMRDGDQFVKQTSRKSLRLLGSVGEPINPEAWQWYFEVAGEKRCPIVDTWWQTETGGILITPLPYTEILKPGSGTGALFGIRAELFDNEGHKIEGPGEGALGLIDSWPGQMRTVHKDHARFEETYFSTLPGVYFTGDGCRRDEDGYLWITGRIDDVIKVSGHRLGTAEIESAFVLDHRVAEAAVVGYPHSIKGQGIYAFVTLKLGVSYSDELKRELIQGVRKEIGPIATPDLVQFTPGLPKTRSGKIMRRILRKIVANEIESLGDTSTLADPSVVEDLIKNRLLLS